MSDATDEASDASASASRIGTNEALTLLADDCRRRILIELLERAPDETVRIRPDAGGLFAEPSERPSEADRALSVSESDEPRHDPGGTEDIGCDPNRLAVELYHNHLPRLAAEGVISWDEEADAVERGTAFPTVRPFVERLDQYDEELPSDWLPWKR